jgi:hypothetical protein
MKLKYLRMLTAPKSIKPGQVLMHNAVMHATDTVCGFAGFRAWTDSKPLPHFIKCPCGWAGLPHYAIDEYVEAIRELLAKHGGQEGIDRYVHRYRQREMRKIGLVWERQKNKSESKA